MHARMSAPQTNNRCIVWRPTLAPCKKFSYVHKLFTVYPMYSSHKHPSNTHTHTHVPQANAIHAIDVSSKHQHSLQAQQAPHMAATARVTLTTKREESPSSMQSSRSDRSSEATSTSNGRSTNDTANGNGSSSTCHPHGTVCILVCIRVMFICMYVCI
jgi:hypothetical protein